MPPRGRHERPGRKKALRTVVRDAGLWVRFIIPKGAALFQCFLLVSDDL